jgi:hypothetical protein
MLFTTEKINEGKQKIRIISSVLYIGEKKKDESKKFFIVATENTAWSGA